jgi:choline dehydrogenase-like flavoprotein
MRIEKQPESFVLPDGHFAGDPTCADPFILRLSERLEQIEPNCKPGGDGKIRFQGWLRFAHEQALNPDSRVTLTAETDRFGLRRPRLDWRLSPLDARTQRVAMTAFGMYMAGQDVGRVRIRDWVLRDPIVWPGVANDEVAGKHHMGTTRMADDPKRGVVDRDCKVHGIANLYVGGSSVFVTGGHANPTYTLTQLVLRLGDRLGEKLNG